MLRPVKVDDYKQYRTRHWKKVSLASGVLSWIVLGLMTGTPFFFLSDWRLYGLLFVCLIAWTNVIAILEFIIELWLGRLDPSILRLAFDDTADHPKATASLMMSFWRNELVLQVFSVVAAVTGVVWSYRSLAPVVRGL